MKRKWNEFRIRRKVEKKLIRRKEEELRKETVRRIRRRAEQAVSCLGQI